MHKYKYNIKCKITSDQFSPDQLLPVFDFNYLRYNRCLLIIIIKIILIICIFIQIFFLYVLIATDAIGPLCYKHAVTQLTQYVI